MISTKWKNPTDRALLAQIFAILMALKSLKVYYTSNDSFNHASSFGNFLKEIHLEFKELWRSFTIEEWTGFRGEFLLRCYLSTKWKYPTDLYVKHYRPGF